LNVGEKCWLFISYRQKYLLAAGNHCCFLTTANPLPGEIIFLRIDRIKYSRTNKNGKKQCYEIHSNAEEEGLVTAYCGESGFAFHEIQIVVFNGILD
jgi:hypothetical protein